MDSDYHTKVTELRKYVPFLEGTITRLKSEKEKTREAQISKLQSLLEILVDPRKKIKLESLKKCEEVILKLYEKVERKPTDAMYKYVCKDPDQFDMKTSTTTDLTTARQRLKNCELITPASPSPPRDSIPKNKVEPVVIPTHDSVTKSYNMTHVPNNNWCNQYSNVPHPVQNVWNVAPQNYMNPINPTPIYRHPTPVYNQQPQNPYVDTSTPMYQRRSDMNMNRDYPRRNLVWIRPNLEGIRPVPPPRELISYDNMFTEDRVRTYTITPKPLHSTPNNSMVPIPMKKSEPLKINIPSLEKVTDLVPLDKPPLSESDLRDLLNEKADKRDKKKHEKLQITDDIPLDRLEELQKKIVQKIEKMNSPHKHKKISVAPETAPAALKILPFTIGQSSSSKLKTPKVAERVIKESGNIFGSLLSKIDEQILVQQKKVVKPKDAKPEPKKEERSDQKDKHKLKNLHKDRSRSRSSDDSSKTKPKSDEKDKLKATTDSLKSDTKDKDLNKSHSKSDKPSIKSKGDLEKSSKSEQKKDDKQTTKSETKPKSEIDGIKSKLESTEKPKNPLESVEKTKLNSEFAEKSKTKSESTEKSKTKSDSTEKSKTKSDSTEKSKTKSESIEKSKTKSDSTEKSKTKPESIEKSKTKPELTEKLKTKFESVEKSKPKSETTDKPKSKPEIINKLKVKPGTTDKPKIKPETTNKQETKPELSVKLKSKRDSIDKPNSEPSTSKIQHEMTDNKQPNDDAESDPELQPELYDIVKKLSDGRVDRKLIDGRSSTGRLSDKYPHKRKSSVESRDEDQQRTSAKDPRLKRNEPITIPISPRSQALGKPYEPTVDASDFSSDLIWQSKFERAKSPTPSFRSRSPAPPEFRSKSPMLSRNFSNYRPQSPYESYGSASPCAFDNFPPSSPYENFGSQSPMPYENVNFTPNSPNPYDGTSLVPQSTHFTHRYPRSQIRPQFDPKPQLHPQFDPKPQLRPQFDPKPQLRPQFDQKPQLRPQFDQKPQQIWVRGHGPLLPTPATSSFGYGQPRPKRFGMNDQYDLSKMKPIDFYDKNAKKNYQPIPEPPRPPFIDTLLQNRRPSNENMVRPSFETESNYNHSSGRGFRGASRGRGAPNSRGRGNYRWSTEEKRPAEPKATTPTVDETVSEKLKTEVPDDTKSPLCSLYAPEKSRAGKGYGMQRFKIPKLKRDSIDDVKELPKKEEETSTKVVEVKTDVEEEVKEEPEPEVKQVTVESDDTKPDSTTTDGDRKKETIDHFIKNLMEQGDSSTFMEILERLGETLPRLKQKKIRRIIDSDSESGTEPEAEHETPEPPEPSKEPIQEDVATSSEIQESDAPPTPSPPKKRGRKPRKKTETPEIKTEVDSPKTRSQIAPKKPRVRHKNELEKLQDDIRDMFICEGVLTATGQRMCRILKEHHEEANKDEDEEPLDEESEPIAKRKRPRGKPNVKPEEELQKTRSPRVLIEKTDLSRFFENDSTDDETEDKPTPPVTRSSPRIKPTQIDETPPKKPHRKVAIETKKAMKRNLEDADDTTDADTADSSSQLDTSTETITPQKRVPKRKMKKKSNWAMGVIKKSKKIKDGKSETSSVGNDIDSIHDDTELNDNDNNADIDYYQDGQHNKECKLCEYRGIWIVQHYRSKHTSSEIFIARLPPDVADKARLDAQENDYSSVVPREEKHQGRKRKFDFECRFCRMEITQEVSNNFYDHLSGHTGEFRYKCEYCGYMSATRGTMSKHFYKEHTNDPRPPLPLYNDPMNFRLIFGYICNVCNFTQLIKENVEKHFSRAHPKDEVDIIMINMSNMTVDLTDFMKADEDAETEEVEDEPEPQPKPKAKPKPKPKSKVKKTPAKLAGPPKKRGRKPKPKPVPVPSPNPETETDNDLENTSVLTEESSPSSTPNRKTTDVVPIEILSIEPEPEPEPELEPEPEPEPPQEVQKEPDLNVFMSSEEITQQEKMIQDERLKKMQEVSDIISQKRGPLSFVEKLRNRLDNLVPEPEAQSEPQFEPQSEPLPEPLSEPQPEPLSELVVQTQSAPTETKWLEITSTYTEETQEQPGEPPATEIQEENIEEVSISQQTEQISDNESENEAPMDVSSLQTEIDVSSRPSMFSDTIQRLAAKLAPRSYEPLVEITELPPPPPLIHQKDMRNSPEFVREDAENFIVNCGPIQAKKFSNYIVFTCLVDGCGFTHDSKQTFTMHCTSQHDGKNENFVCQVCENEGKNDKRKYVLISMFVHLLDCHLQVYRKMPKIWEEVEECIRSTGKCLRVRRLSGDLLSAPNVEPEPTPSLPPSTSITTATATTTTVASMEFSLQISNVKSLTPEEESELFVSKSQPSASELTLPPLQPITKSEKSTQSLLVRNVKVRTYKKSSKPKILKSNNMKVMVVPELKQVSGPTIKTLKANMKNDIIKFLMKNCKDMVPDDIDLLDAGRYFYKIWIYKQPNVLVEMLQPEKLSHLFKCAVYFCVYTTDNVAAFQQHLGSHKTISQAYNCVYCYEKVSIDVLCEHVEQMHSHCKFQCPQCLSYRASCASFVMMHQKIFHSTKYMEPILVKNPGVSIFHNIKRVEAVQPFICGQAVNVGVKGQCHSQFIVMDEFVIHLRVNHVGAKRYECGICKNGGGTLKHLLQHYLGHQIGLFQCKYCVFASATAHTMYLHCMQLHEFREPYAIIRRHGNKSNTIYLTQDDVRNNLEVVNMELLVEKLLQIPASTETNSPESKVKPMISAATSTSTLTEIEVIDLCDDPPETEPEPETAPETETEINEAELQPDHEPEPEIDVENETEDHFIANEPEVFICHRNLQSKILCDTAKDPLSIEPDDADKTLEVPAIEEGEDVDMEAEETVIGLSGTALYRCASDGCDTATESLSEFKFHLYRCTGTNDGMYACVHCSRKFKYVLALIDHIRVHGILRYSCSMCTHRTTLSAYMSKHMKIAHQINLTKTVSANPKKTDVENNLYVMIPRIAKPKKSKETPSTPPKDVEEKQAIEKTTFSPSEIDQLPQKSIFQTSMYCSVCKFNTKVRTNLMRHLEAHKNNEAFSEQGPVNPVPCLERNEKMFDKMLNLANSSNSGRMGGKEKLSTGTDEDTPLPLYVPLNKRFVCGADGCSYLTHDDQMLMCHISTLHSNEINYRCPHCFKTFRDEDNELSEIIPDIIFHYKLHDTRLYKCLHCPFMHFRKTKVDSHLSDKHPDRLPYISIIRDDTTEETVEADTTTEVTDTKPWRCGLCPYRTSSRTDVQNHMANSHNTKSQFKCGLCSYKCSAKQNFNAHYKSRHPEEELNIVAAYYKEDTPSPVKQAPEPEREVSTFDTTPLWRRDMPRVRHIRGILLDEKSHGAKKPKGSADPKPQQTAESPGKAVEEKKHDSLLSQFMNMTELHQKYFIDPSGECFVCPLCKTYRTKSQEFFKTHFYKELKCNREDIAITNSIIPMHLDTIMKYQEAVISKNYLIPSEQELLQFNEPSTSSESMPLQQLSSDATSPDLENLLVESSSKSIAMIPKRTSSSSSLQCEYCDFMAKTASILKMHQTRHWVLEEYLCGLCKYKGDTMGNFKLHHMAKHPNEELTARIVPLVEAKFRPIKRKNTNVPDTPNKVVIIDEEEFNKEDSGDTLIYVCYSCPKRSSTLSEVENHWNLMHKNPMNSIFKYKLKRLDQLRPKKPTSYACHYCERVDALPQLKEHHAITHPQEKFLIKLHKNLECKHCGKKYMKRVMLERHITDHHPFLEERQPEPTVLPPPMLTQRPVQIHECPICEHADISRFGLETHFNTHSVYSCNNCARYELNKQAIAAHHAAQHDDLILSFSVEKNVSLEDYLSASRKAQRNVARKSTAMAPMRPKLQVARKSTAKPPSSFEFSYYGTQPPPIAAYRLVTTEVSVMGATVRMNVGQLSHVFNLAPKVLVEDFRLNDI